MSKKIAILQSNYIPWKGYFDIIASVDEFIFYDEMQYTKNDWRNRNKIKSNQGTHWLSIPVITKGHLSNEMRIIDAKIADHKWINSHWNTIKQFYKKAPYFDKYSDVLKNFIKNVNKKNIFVKLTTNLFMQLIKY